MKRLLQSPFTVWTLAILVTLTLAAFQRMTGPTHPRRGTVTVGGTALPFRLPRSHGGPGGLEVSVNVSRLAEVSGIVQWRLYPGRYPWQTIPMERDGARLVARIPHQPPAGKVEYRILLERPGGASVRIPPDGPVVARFKGAVPLGVLLPHILCMFLSMLLATYAFFRVAVGGPPPRISVLLGMLFLIAGGLFLGPVVQHHAFGAYWTGWPYGTDLTDNKTAIAFLAWLPATILALGRRKLRTAVVVGWIVMMGVFLIPHSLRGSQIDWQKEGVGSAATPAGPGGSVERSGSVSPAATGAQAPREPAPAAAPGG